MNLASSIQTLIASIGQRRKNMNRIVILLTAMMLVAIAMPWAGATTTYQAFLLGTNSVPSNASPATGYGTAILNNAQDMITVNLSWTGLVANATAAHIHGPAAPGVNAQVVFPFSGVPNATSGSIPQQTFAITAAQVVDLQNGLFYMNLHTSVYPGGEIRGQLALAPEPSSIVSLLAGIGTLCWRIRRRR
jgi:hypothetical protein